MDCDDKVDLTYAERRLIALGLVKLMASVRRDLMAPGIKDASWFADVLQRFHDVAALQRRFSEDM